MDIHQRNHIWVIKWISSILMVVTMALTAVNIFPLNVKLGLISSIGWLYVSLRWADRSLIILNSTAVFIYILGIVKLFS